MAIVPAEMNNLLDMRLQKYQLGMEHGGTEEQSRVMKLRQKLLKEYSMAAGVGESTNKISKTKTLKSQKSTVNK